MTREDARRFWDYARARESVRQFRLSGRAWPWTDDPILRRYKFTNVKREHDRTSTWLRSWYEDHAEAPREEHLLNCALARFFGTSEFVAAVGWISPTTDSRWRVRVRRIAAERLARRERVFTGAYVISNQGRRAPKQDVIVGEVLDGVWRARDDLLLIAGHCCRWRLFVEALRRLPGLGGTGFMAKEVTLDTLWTPVWASRPTDLNSWCPAGPGARRGVNRVLGKLPDAPLREVEALEVMLRLFDQRKAQWPITWPRLELHDIQFTLCEFDKYERARLGEGRPRSTYRPPTETR